MTNQVNYSLIYDELGLNPIWKVKVHKSEKKDEICFLQKIFFNKINIFFLALTNEEQISSKQKLFGNISLFLRSFCDVKTDPYIKLTQKNFACSEDKPDIIFLTADKYHTLSDYLIQACDSPKIIFSNTSLSEMIKDSKKKEVLWQDIQTLNKNTKK